MAAVVAALAFAAGFRSWGLHGDQRILGKLGVSIISLVAFQLFLGVIALVFRSGPDKAPTPEGAILTTIHQANGAVLLAFSSMLWVWTHRLLRPNPTNAEVGPGGTAAAGVP
jgi:hypothetical protein